jgi:hypothetical protein
LSWVAGMTHVFCTLEHPDTFWIWVHSHCIVTLMGMAYILNAWKNLDTMSAVMFTVLVLFFWFVLYHALKYLLYVRQVVRKFHAASLSNKASSFMIQGFTVMGILSYFACEIIGNCVISDGFDSDKCDQYARATCIVGFQVGLAWAVQLMLFQTGALSHYKVLVLKLSLFQWIAGVLFVLCLLISMVCYSTRQNSGVPGAVLIADALLCMLTIFFTGLSVSYDVKPEEDEDEESSEEAGRSSQRFSAVL